MNRGFMTTSALLSLYLAPTFSGLEGALLDLPWDQPLLNWPGHCSHVVDLPRGLSRHPVLFVNLNGTLLALKELPISVAEKEFHLLSQMVDLRLPVVTPVGYGNLQHAGEKPSVLITRYMEYSIPYRSLFMQVNMERYRDHLLDAIAGLLVQLHLAGVFWGDCSLSNTLYRKDAGALQAYLVDAETAEIYPPRLSPTLRLHDLEIMEVDVEGDLVNLENTGMLAAHFPTVEIGNSIRRRYQNLWEAITREEVINEDERYRIHERIRALNTLGYSVRDVIIQPTAQGEKLRFRVMVTDRNFHRDQLFSLTGLEAEEMQAQKMMNEIQEVRATLSRYNSSETPLSVAAYYWLSHDYMPVIQRLEPILQGKTNGEDDQDPVELYCQVLEHKWYLSERAHHDVGHLAAVDDYMANIAHKGAT